MTCPICGRTIGTKDAIVDTEEGWAHKACGGMTELPVVLERPVDSLEPQGILDEVAATISRMLDVPGLPTDQAWRDHRAANITHVLGTHFRIERRA